MTGLDIFALIVLLLLALSAIALIVILGALPGRIARSRGHPWAQAVSVAGWIALLFIPLWPLALIWAYVDVPQKQAPNDLDDVTRRLARLENSMRVREPAE